MSDIGNSLLDGAREALAYAKGNQLKGKVHVIEVPEHINVVVIRDRLAMTRRQFADAFGFSLRTLEKWERGERRPEAAARAYLKVIASNPKAVIRALNA